MIVLILGPEMTSLEFTVLNNTESASSGSNTSSPMIVTTTHIVSVIDELEEKVNVVDSGLKSSSSIVEV